MKKTAFLFILILSFVTHDILGQCVSVGSNFSKCHPDDIIADLGGSLDIGGTDALWSDNGAGGVFSNPSDPHSMYTISSSFTGTATLTLTLASCPFPENSASLKVIVTTPPTINLTSPVCASNLATYSFTADVSAGTVSATPGSAVLTSVNNWTVTVPAGSNTVVTVSDGACEVSIPVTAPDCVCPIISPPVSGGDKSYCDGGSIPALTASVSVGETVDWFNSVSGGTALTSGLSYNPPAAGTYYAEARNTTSNCVSSTRTAVVLTVNSLPTATIVSSDADNTFCAGTSVTFTASGGTNYNFRVAGASAQNGAGTTFTASGLTDGQIVDVIVTNANSCAATSDGITNNVRALPTPTISSSDADNTFCTGTSVTFTATGGTNYNFRVAGVSQQNSVVNTYTNNSLTNGQVVDVIVTNANGCSATASGITNTVRALPVPVLTSSDADNTICAGTSVTFTASGGTTYTFFIGGANVQSGPISTYTTSSLTNGQDVYVVVGNAALCTAASSSIHFVVNPVPTITQSSPTTCASNLTTYSFTVLVSAGTVTTTAGVVALTGSNVWTVTVPTGQSPTVSVTSGGCLNSITITAPNCACPVVNAPLSGGDKTYCAGTVIPALTATVGVGETIDWYNAVSGGSSLGTGLSFTPAIPGTYYALTRNTTTNCVSSARTPITLTSFPLPVASIVSSDADNIFCTGASVTFTASGGNSYNFMIAGVSAQNGVNSTFTTTALTDGQIVDVIVTNENNCSATSSGITNTVRALPTATLVSSDADNTFCSGTSVTFTASGGTNYNFRVDGSNVQASASATYVTNALLDHQVVDVIVTNGGCAATSAGITNIVSAIPVPVLTSSDADHQFCSGTSVSFMASAGSANYNFRVGGVTAQNGASEVFTSSTITNGQVVDVITTNATGCSATSAGITNIVSPQPVANGGAGGNVCGLSYKFSGVPSIGTGTWTKTTGPGTVSFLPNANASNASVTVSEYGTYTFTWTEVSGQCSSSSVVTVNFYLQPVASAGSGGNNCGLGFHFNGGLNTGTGTWAKVSGPGNVTYTPNANTPNALVTVTSYGTYTFSWTVANGTCTNSQNVSVVFLQQVPAAGGTGGNECDLDFVLGAVVPVTGTGTWSKFSGPGSVVFTPDNHTINSKVTVDKFGTYDFAWSVINSTCSSSDVIRVVFHDLPSIYAGRDTALCKGGTIQLRAQGTGTVLWSPGTKLNNRNIINPIASPDTTTTYTINLTDQYGCKNSDKIIVDVRDPILANAGPDQELGYVLNATMDATLAHDYEKGSWSLLSGTGVLSDRADPKTSVENLSIGINEFLWTVSNGYCPISYDTANIVVNDFVIPTMITPNMDGRNDYFELRGLSTLGKTELVVFNRRGVQLFKNSDYDNLWDGVDYNNNPLPEDTYFYVLKTANGKSLSGYLVIRR